MKLSRFNLEELQIFRSTQKLAYDCVRAVEKQLEAGMTERDACALMKEDLRKRGVTQFFHEPFAWFGDRTALRGFGPDTDFLPTDRKLEKGMPVILDIAPIRDGYAADIGYSTSFGRNADVEAMQQALMECRDFILQSVRTRKPFRQIYQELDSVIARHGFLNVHRIYPERVLAHRVFRYEHSPVQRFLQRFRVWASAYQAISTYSAGRRSPGRSRVWWSRRCGTTDPNRITRRRRACGLSEPHIATTDYSAGAKWEEILVVTEDDAFWLDDGVPHCELARKKGWWPATLPVSLRSAPNARAPRHEQQHDPRLSFRALTRSRCRSSDLRLTERWFREGLGFLPAGGSRLAMRSPLASRIQGLPKAASTCWWLVDRNEVFQLELFQFEKPLAKLMPADFRPCDIGYTRIGVWVADFDASLRRLEALGTSPLTPALGQRGARRVCVRSPDGVFVELMESDPLSTESSSTRRDCGVAVRSITLSVPDLQQTASFIEQGIGLREAHVSLHTPEHEALWGLAGARTQSKTFVAGDVLVEVVQYLSPQGKPWPEGYRISDQGILNIAFGARNKRDHAEVYRRCIAAGARPNCQPVQCRARASFTSTTRRASPSSFCGPNPDGRIGCGASSPCRSPGGRRRTRRRSNSVCASRRPSKALGRSSRTTSAWLPGSGSIA